MDIRKAVESRDLNPRAVVGGVAATLVGGFAIGFGVNSYIDNQEQVRNWLNSRGVAACDEAPVSAPCVSEVGATTSIATIERPHAGAIVVSCFFSDSPMAPEPGCYIDLPDNHSKGPNDVLITSPQSILDA